MNEQRVRELLKELVAEIESMPSVDRETADLIRKLEADIHEVIDPEVDTADNSVLDDALVLQTEFASRHPVAESLLRELIHSLEKIGI